MVPSATNFSNMRLAGLLHQLRAHDQVLVEELAGSIPVGANAANNGSQMHDPLRPRLAQTRSNLIGLGQVVLYATGSGDAL